MISAYEKIEPHLKIFCFVLGVLFVFMDFVGFGTLHAGIRPLSCSCMQPSPRRSAVPSAR
jgi:hypothetical protein